MNTSLFATFCLGLTTVSALFYGEAKEYFHRPDFFHYEINGLKKSLERAEYNHFLTKYEFEDFRAHVATLLPAEIKQKGPGEKSFPMRSLASVVQKSSGDDLRLLRANQVFENAKANFRAKKFEQAISGFQDLIRDHAFSAHVNEAMFLLVESHFQIREHDAVVETVNKMLEVFPESELTGYALLRLAKVYEHKDRHDDAIEIYETILKVFPQRDLASLARASLRSTEL